MKKLLISCMLLCSMSGFAQKEKVTLKAGTFVELESAQTVRAKDASEGDLIRFRVISDVKVNGKVVIPVGTMAEARVAEAKKSQPLGTKGALRLNLANLILEDGSKVPLSGNCNVYGKNRTPLAVVLGCFVWPCLFIPGTKAVLPEGYHTSATIFTNTEIEI